MSLLRHRAAHKRFGERCISVSFVFVERLEKEQLLVLRKVFPRACIELGIGAQEDDERAPRATGHYCGSIWCTARARTRSRSVSP